MPIYWCGTSMTPSVLLAQKADLLFLRKLHLMQPAKGETPPGTSTQVTTPNTAQQDTQTPNSTADLANDGHSGCDGHNAWAVMPKASHIYNLNMLRPSKTTNRMQQKICPPPPPPRNRRKLNPKTKHIKGCTTSISFPPCWPRSQEYLHVPLEWDPTWQTRSLLDWTLNCNSSHS